MKVCGLCKKEGHPRNECPDETKTIKLVPLLPVSNKFRGMLDRICYRIFGKKVVHKESNPHHTLSITPKRVSSGKAHLRGLALEKHRKSPRWLAVGDSIRLDWPGK